MKRDDKYARAVEDNTVVRWSRRAFGLFVTTVATATAIWRPRMFRGKTDVSGKVADHWVAVSEKQRNTNEPTR